MIFSTVCCQRMTLENAILTCRNCGIRKEDLKIFENDIVKSHSYLSFFLSFFGFEDPT